MRQVHSLTRLDPQRLLVAPSILAADFSRLGEDIRRVEAAGADVLHVDVMDGHFVPNISLGPPVVAGLRGCTKLPFDVHLMISDPGRYVEAFAAAGADHLTIHVEIEGAVGAVLERIAQLGCSAGLCLRPATPVAALEPYLDLLDLVLVMTVEPGFGGQAFRDDMLPKIRELRSMAARSRRPFHIEVDGGIAAATAPLVVAAGANLLVAGTSVFRHPGGAAAAIAELRGGGGEQP